MARLVVRSGPEAGRACEVSGVAVVGRDPTCDLVLTDPRVSRRHAHIRATDAGFLLEDLGTTNGTYLNGVRTERSDVLPGDRIEVGDTVLALSDALEVADRPATAVVAGVDSHIQAAVSAIAAPAVATVEQLRERLDLFSHVSDALGSAIGVDELFGRILAALFDVFQQAHRGFIILADGPHGPFHVQTQRLRAGQDADVALSRTIIEHVLARQEAVLSRDAAADSRFAGAGSIIAHGIRSVMCAPLLYAGEALGLIQIDTTDARRPFSQAELHTLAALAPQVALRIRHARLVDEHIKTERLAAIGQTVAGLAHCVKNILNGIAGGSYILDRALEHADAARINQGWTMVKRNNAFMSDLVLDMLTYAREREPTYEPVDPRQLLDAVRDLAGIREARQAVTITCDVDPALQTVVLDGTAMKRCLLNLVANAVEACLARSADPAAPDGPGDGAHVRLACAPGPQPDTVRFTVSDTGCGIPEEHLARLFGLFFSTKGSKGTGLGLAVCKKIVDEHGGTIGVTSTVGQGTQFTVDLPMRRPADETKTRTAEQEGKSRGVPDGRG